MGRKREYRLPETLSRLMERHPVTGKKTSQKELARYLGVRQQTVSLYLKGTTVPTGTICIALADYFEVSADYILVGHEDGKRYVSMMDARCRRIYEELDTIAAFCFGMGKRVQNLIESEARHDAQEQ